MSKIAPEQVDRLRGNGRFCGSLGERQKIMSWKFRSTPSDRWTDAVHITVRQRGPAALQPSPYSTSRMEMARSLVSDPMMNLAITPATNPISIVQIHGHSRVATAGAGLGHGDTPGRRCRRGLGR